MDRKKIISNFYENYDEDGRLLSRYGQVEFLTTMRYIEKYLRRGMKVLEIGAGTGRYSHSLAGAGYEVDAVELVEHNIDIFRQNTQDGEKVTITQGDATHLDGFADEAYDVTLLLGPMYHLFDEESKLAALSEAVRVTKRGGAVFAAYCGNDSCVIQYLFGKGMINSEHYRGMIDPDSFMCASDPTEHFELYRKEHIDALMEKLCAVYPVRRLHYVGTDMYAHYMKDALAAMDDDTFALYMKHHFTICERSDMVGLSNHILDIFERK